MLRPDGALWPVAQVWGAGFLRRRVTTCSSGLSLQWWSLAWAGPGVFLTAYHGRVGNRPGSPSPVFLRSGVIRERARSSDPMKGVEHEVRAVDLRRREGLGREVQRGAGPHL